MSKRSRDRKGWRWEGKRGNVDCKQAGRGPRLDGALLSTCAALHLLAAAAAAGARERLPTESAQNARKAKKRGGDKDAFGERENRSMALPAQSPRLCIGRQVLALRQLPSTRLDRLVRSVNFARAALLCATTGGQKNKVAGPIAFSRHFVCFSPAAPAHRWLLGVSTVLMRRLGRANRSTRASFFFSHPSPFAPPAPIRALQATASALHRKFPEACVHGAEGGFGKDQVTEAGSASLSLSLSLFFFSNPSQTEIRSTRTGPGVGGHSGTADEDLQSQKKVADVHTLPLGRLNPSQAGLVATLPPPAKTTRHHFCRMSAWRFVKSLLRASEKQTVWPSHTRRTPSPPPRDSILFPHTDPRNARSV